MSSVDPSSSAPVISLNSMTQASLVVRALRSQKSSRERYQDFNQHALDVKSLNTAILSVKTDQEAHAAKKADVDRKLDSWTSSAIRDDKPEIRNGVESDREDSEDERDRGQITSAKGKLSAAAAEDDFDFDEDPEDNRELFKDFVAPKSRRPRFESTTIRSTSASKQLSSTTSSSVTQPSLITSKGIVIKPGQAIRVKAHGNRSKAGATSEY